MGATLAPLSLNTSNGACAERCALLFINQTISFEPNFAGPTPFVFILRHDCHLFATCGLEWLKKNIEIYVIPGDFELEQKDCQQHGCDCGLVGLQFISGTDLVTCTTTIRADSHCASRFRSVIAPYPFRQNGQCSHCPSCSATFHKSAW